MWKVACQYTFCSLSLCMPSDNLFPAQIQATFAIAEPKKDHLRVKAGRLDQRVSNQILLMLLNYDGKTILV